MAKRISMTEQERGELVLRLLRNEATAGELAREHSISGPTFYQWRNAFLDAGFASLAVGRRRNDVNKRHQRELAKRDQVIGELTIAKRVLKKQDCQIFHWTERRIHAHVAIVFMTLMCVRHLQLRLEMRDQRMS